jgi:S-formylglutathione hydrolase FrmB
LLPVLVLLAVQPSAPADWVNGGRIADTMDQFAATHHGVAPVVVMPDATGGGLNNPLCADTKVGGMSETYLTTDVPAWLRANLQVRPDRWAIAGLSYGGTCAIQLALRHPDVLPSFVDMSGQSEPTLGSHARTVRDLFGGDENAFRQINPADLLATRRFPGTAGVLTVGGSDREYGPQQRKLLELCQQNGLDVTWHEVPGAHSWQAWAGGLQASLDWLSKRMELVW